MSTPAYEANARAFASTRAKVQIGNTDNGIIGWVNDFSIQESFGNVPIRVFGHAEVQVFETVSYNVSGSFSYMHIVDQKLAKGEKTAWFDLPWDGAANANANKNIISFTETTLKLSDWTSNKVCLSIKGFRPEGRAFRLSEGAVTMVNCTFVAFSVEEWPVTT